MSGFDGVMGGRRGRESTPEELAETTRARWARNVLASLPDGAGARHRVASGSGLVWEETGREMTGREIHAGCRPGASTQFLGGRILHLCDMDALPTDGDDASVAVAGLVGGWVASSEGLQEFYLARSELARGLRQAILLGSAEVSCQPAPAVSENGLGGTRAAPLTVSVGEGGGAVVEVAAGSDDDRCQVPLSAGQLAAVTGWAQALDARY